EAQQAAGHPATVVQFFRRGSSASRKPSPTRLIAMTAAKIMMPGGIHSQGFNASTRQVRASVSMLPHEGRGGWTPRPRKERALSVRIALATPRVAATTRGATAL